MNALGGPYADAWRELGVHLPKPAAILMVSAHWYVPHLAVTAMARPQTIHDFHGFPKPLYDLRYSAPGSLALADCVVELLKPDIVKRDAEWGLDHGAWSVLMHYAPVADVPVVQLSIDRTQPASFHYQIGQRLAPMRDEGVLIAGSGDVVHNLRHMNLAPGAPAYPWAQRFHDRVKEAIVREDHTSLVNFGLMGDDAVQSVPTPEHYLPLLYVLGARRFDDQVRFFTVSIDLGSISMLGVQVGI